MNQFMQTLPQNPCFQQLPAWLQENIMQSGVTLTTEQELQAFASSFLKGETSR